MRAFRIWSKSQKISIRSRVMAELLNFRCRRSQRSESWDDRPDSISAITHERVEIFWLLNQILKALIEADRMVPLLRVYEVDLSFWKFFSKKKTYWKKTYSNTFFFPVDFYNSIVKIGSTNPRPTRGANNPRPMRGAENKNGTGTVISPQPYRAGRNSPLFEKSQTV